MAIKSNEPIGTKQLQESLISAASAGPRSREKLGLLGGTKMTHKKFHTMDIVLSH